MSDQDLQRSTVESAVAIISGALAASGGDTAAYEAALGVLAEQVRLVGPELAGALIGGVVTQLANTAVVALVALGVSCGVDVDSLWQAVTLEVAYQAANPVDGRPRNEQDADQRGVGDDDGFGE